MRKSIRTPEQMHLQSLLKEVRVEAALSQMDVAGRLGKPQSFVSKYESGERRLDLPELREVSQALGISLGELVKRFESGLVNRK
ncbi:MAG TPA: XRE family transcriptional regulator [Candidatus Marinimicrobia bacterium]|nr:XRE family transcriptional regulator [Candidatus Neomarinimicrobiota bacterium]